MGTEKETNLKTLLSKNPKNVIITSKYLTSLGISHDLQKRYEKNGWLKRLSQGAYITLGDSASLDGAIYALQKQLNLSIHIGGISALNNYYGITHNISYSDKNTQLFGFRSEKLPKWFKTLYGINTQLNCTTFLPKDIGLVEIQTGDFKIKVSTLERAVLEMLYLVPEKIMPNEAYQIIELLITVKPKEFQLLLEKCSSVKVKRLFLYLAELSDHSWFKRLDLSKIDLGKGVREITKGGKHNSKYNIIIGNVKNI
ncbi:MAG: type IV toxin-antitoxin system AbiEi family antitoxin [bacterium]|nr:type IV toxin-antitoxin system AbiEi family antitoxin [bacterium]